MLDNVDVMLMFKWTLFYDARKVLGFSTFPLSAA